MTKKRGIKYMNTNGFVWIYLTKEGRKFYEEEIRRVCQGTISDADAIVKNQIPKNGLVRMTMWAFMNLFGPKMHIGGDRREFFKQIYLVNPAKKTKMGNKG